MSSFFKVKNYIKRYIFGDFKNSRLLIFLIIILELFASIFEFVFINSNSLSSSVQRPFYLEFFISLLVTSYVGFVMYTFIFLSKRNFFISIFSTIVGLYLLITNDFSLSFLMHNIEPTHFFKLEFSIALVFELLIKLLITYIIYKLFMLILKNRELSK